MISAQRQNQNGIRGLANSVRSLADGSINSKEVWEPLKAFEKTSRNWVSANPYIALGIAATIGVTVGCLIKRQ